MWPKDEIVRRGGQAFPTYSAISHCDEGGMTLRQYAAIKLRVPESGDGWLDDMILASLRSELAAKALAGFMANKEHATTFDPRDDAAYCYALADAMLAARNEEQTK